MQPNAKDRGYLEDSRDNQHKMWGLWVTAETISKNMGSLGDSSAENKGTMEPYIGYSPLVRRSANPKVH